MKLQTIKKLITFIMTVMMFSVFPNLLNAQSSCQNGSCPPGYYCVNNKCKKFAFCSCSRRPIPFQCGQICGWYTDPNNIGNLISITDGSIIGVDLNLEEAENASFKIYDVTGKLIKTLANAEILFTEHQFEWDKTDSSGNSVSPGLYILQLDAGPGYAGTQKRFVIN